jgi:hypothetical protein
VTPRAALLVRCGLAVGAGGAALVSILGEGPVPEHPHLLPLATLGTGLALLGLGVRLRRGALRWLLEVGLGAGLTLALALLAQLLIGTLIVRIAGLRGENTLAALLPAIAGGGLLAIALLFWLQARRSRGGTRPAGEALALGVETVAVLLVLLLAWE